MTSGAIAAGDSPFIAPVLALRVGVTGHRPNRLDGVDVDLLRDCAGLVLRCLGETTRRLRADAAETAGGDPFAPGDPEFRLATAIAEGADRFVADAALDEGYGLNLIFPFSSSRYAQDFEDAALDDFHRLCALDAVRSITELDVRASDPIAYRAAGLLTLSHADVVIAVWDEKDEAGIGGTAEIAREARRRGLITVLIDLRGGVRLWTVPDTALYPLEDGHWAPLMLDEQDLCSNPLSERLRALLSFPDFSPKAAPGRHTARTPAAALGLFRADRLRRYCWAWGYSFLYWAFFMTSRFSFRVDNGLERERSTAWSKTQKTAESIGGVGFRERIDARLRDRWIAADNLAVYYSHKFRSAFVTNFALSALAVIVGLLAVFFWESKGTKATVVAVELALIAFILFNTWRGHRGDWLNRWMEYRSLAEAFRPARLPVLIGNSPLGARDDAVDSPGAAWISWYVRASLREIGPPTAILGRVELSAAIDVALQEEVAGQIGYHREKVEMLHRLDHRLERTAETALWLTVVAGAVYLGLYGAYSAGMEYPGISPALIAFKPWATVLGAGLPVIGAAIFGIRATADFRSAMRQSISMEAELTDIRSILTDRADSLDRHETSAVFAQLGRTLSDDVDMWENIYSGRELPPGF